MLRFLVFILSATPSPDTPHEACALQQREWLSLPAEAEDATHGRGEAGVWVRYDVEEPYPAPRETSRVLRVLADRGWVLVQEGEFRVVPRWEDPFPAYSASRQPAIETHAWEARWRRSGRLEVIYWIEYRCALEHLGLHSAWARVTAGCQDVDDYQAILEAKRREARGKTPRGRE